MSLQSRRTFIKCTAAGLGAGLGIAGTPWSGTASAADKPARMRFAICNETFGDWPFDKAFATAADCGYQGIEIAPFTISNHVTDVPSKRRAEVRRQAEKAGLEIIGLHWILSKTEGFHLTSPEKEVRRKTTEYLVALARFCADLDGKLLVFGSPKQRNLLPGVDRDKAMGYAAEVIRATLPALEETDTVLAMEPLSPATTSFLTTAADVVELVRMVGSPRCRLILDCCAMSSESKPIGDLIRRNRSMLVHVHANDPNALGPGFGKLDFVPIFQALKDINYRGWISVEVFDYTPGPERLARQSLQYMKKCLSELE